jgi:hypothetical protein
MQLSHGDSLVAQDRGDVGDPIANIVSTSFMRIDEDDEDSDFMLVFKIDPKISDDPDKFDRQLIKVGLLEPLSY